MNFLHFTRECDTIIQARSVSLQFSDVKFRQDSVHQTVLKPVHFSPSYSKLKRAGAFFEPQCIFVIHIRYLFFVVARPSGASAL